MGIKQTGVPLGAVAISLIAAFMTDVWRWLAISLAVAMLLTTFLFLKLAKEQRTGAPPHIIRDLRTVLGQRQLILINAGGFFYNMAFGCLLAYLVTYAYQEVKISAGAASLLLAIIQVRPLSRAFCGELLGMPYLAMAASPGC